MTKTRIKRVIISALLCLVLSLGMFTPFLLPASAAESDVSVKSYEETSIEDDLAGLDLNIYPFNPLGECEVISFMEYCYSEHSDVSGHYGLYVYVYNPTKEPIYDSELNKLNIKVGNGEFEKISLKYLNKTSDNLFYKFKLEGQEELLNLAKSYASENGSIRRYELTELEIKYSGETVKSFDISKVYEYFGYAAYCDSERTNVSTLSCKDYGARSIHLNIQQTNYRAGQKSDNLYEDLQSVYFSLPNEYISEWGNLNKITAEWYQYKTAPMFVTSDMEAYSALFNMRNKYVDKEGYISDESNVVAKTNYVVFWEIDKGIDDKNRIHKVYGGNFVQLPVDFFYYADDLQILTGLKWIFPITEEFSNADDYYVSSEEVKQYIENYTQSFPEQDKLNDKYSEKLFERYDNDGYRNNSFFITEKIDFVDKNTNQSFWEKLWGINSTIDSSYAPIATISQGDLYLSAEAFSAKYYVNKEDAEDVIDFAKESYRKNETPYLLRFAKTDYYSSPARFVNVDNISEEMFGTYDGYVAQETVFLDFDVISLGFMSADGYTETLVGVVAEPIDIINGLTPPDELVENQEWWQKIMMLLSFIVIGIVAIILFPIINFIFDILWWAIKGAFSISLWFLTAPFRLLAWFLR
ncbi:MAG: hypothetical protein IJW38_00760 [Clostridia bacterium]|nr:hypothetical protein [Clostridia bacterium]